MGRGDGFSPRRTPTRVLYYKSLRAQCTLNRYRCSRIELGSPGAHVLGRNRLVQTAFAVNSTVSLVCRSRTAELLKGINVLRFILGSPRQLLLVKYLWDYFENIETRFRRFGTNENDSRRYARVSSAADLNENEKKVKKKNCLVVKR
jgi:hypothetical protein